MFANRNLDVSYFTTKKMHPELRRAEMGAFVDQFATYVQFRNETRYTLAIINRANIRTVLHPIRGGEISPGSLLVRVSNSPRPGVKSYVDDQYSVGQPELDVETKTWKQAIENKPYETAPALRAGQAANESSVVYTITEDEILDNLGSLYVANLDIVIAVMDGEGKQPPPHPFSRMGSIATIHEMTTKAFGSDKFCYAIKIVDRHNRFGDRFVNFGGRVVEIKAEKNVTTNIADGVYLTTNVASKGNLYDSPFVTEVYSFEEADIRLPLYRSYSEAEAFGDVENQRKRELDRERFEFEKLKNKEMQEAMERKRRLAIEEEVIAEKQRMHEKELREKQIEIERLKAEAAERDFRVKLAENELKARQMHEEYYVDGINLKRKAFFETIKVVGTAITAGLTIYALAKKQGGSSGGAK